MRKRVRREMAWTMMQWINWWVVANDRILRGRIGERLVRSRQTAAHSHGAFQSLDCFRPQNLLVLDGSRDKDSAQKCWIQERRKDTDATRFATSFSSDIVLIDETVLEDQEKKSVQRERRWCRLMIVEWSDARTLWSLLHIHLGDAAVSSSFSPPRPLFYSLFLFSGSSVWRHIITAPPLSLYLCLLNVNRKHIAAAAAVVDRPAADLVAVGGDGRNI